MKWNLLSTLSLTVAVVFFLTSTTAIFSQQMLQGDKYKVVIPNLSPGGDFLINEDDTYEMLVNLGQGFSDPTLYSDLYKLTAGDVFFEPFIPKVACFETTTNGTSDCETGPEFLNENGMVRVCGPTGCYDRARFEIDPNDNPTDTLYGIQVSTDNFAEDIKYLDGVTYMLKDSKTIDDYKTKTDWENNVFNILGLQSQTQYFLRITALYGDLTESAPSEMAQTTTSIGSMEFRVGVGYENGENINYNPPYEIHFDEAFKIIRGANVRSSDRLIWTLINSNSINGITIVQKGEYGGLHNSEVEEEGYTIESLSGDLDLEEEGIGLKNSTISQLYNNGDGSLGSITVEEEYDTEENNVGIIDTIFKKTYQSDGPIHTGQTSLQIKTKAALTTPEGEYAEDITFVLIAKY